MKVIKYLRIRHFLFAVALGSVASGYVLYNSYQPTSKYVDIDVYRNPITVPLRVPRDFIGPSFLKIAENNQKGGQHKKVLLTVAYPSMLPWKSNEADRTNEDILVITLSTGVTPYVRGLWNRWKKPSLEATGEAKLGLNEYKYKEKIKVSGPMNRMRNWYYFDGDQQLGPAYITCTHKRLPNPRCTAITELENLLIVEFSFHRDLLPDWRNVSSKTHMLIKDFIK